MIKIGEMNMSKVDIGANMVVWEDSNVIGIPRFTIWDKSRRKVYFLEEGRGRAEVSSWDESTINANNMDNIEGCSRIPYDTLPEKIKVAVNSKRNG